MRRRIATALIVAVASATALCLADAPSYRVIVNPRNQASSIDRKLLAQLFLKKITRWQDGQMTRPVDLDPDSQSRRRFSEEVLNRSVSAVKSYWQQMIFSGRDVPPPELDSDDEVVRFVLRHPGGIGYVSGAHATGAAKVLDVE